MFLSFPSPFLSISCIYLSPFFFPLNFLRFPSRFSPLIFFLHLMLWIALKPFGFNFCPYPWVFFFSATPVYSPFILPVPYHHPSFVTFSVNAVKISDKIMENLWTKSSNTPPPPPLNLYSSSAHTFFYSYPVSLSPYSSLYVFFSILGVFFLLLLLLFSTLLLSTFALFLLLRLPSSSILGHLLRALFRFSIIQHYTSLLITPPPAPRPCWSHPWTGLLTEGKSASYQQAASSLGQKKLYRQSETTF